MDAAAARFEECRLRRVQYVVDPVSEARVYGAVEFNLDIAYHRPEVHFLQTLALEVVCYPGEDGLGGFVILGPYHEVDVAGHSAFRPGVASGHCLAFDEHCGYAGLVEQGDDPGYHGVDGGVTLLCGDAGGHQFQGDDPGDVA